MSEVTDQDISDFIEHFGKKGMRWGQRKDRSNHGLNARASKLQARADKRPTRGNIRSAERAKNRANKSSSKYTTKQSLAIVGATGAAFIVSRKLNLNLPVTSLIVASSAVSVANRINMKNGAMKVKDLQKK